MMVLRKIDHLRGIPARFGEIYGRGESLISRFEVTGRQATENLMAIKPEEITAEAVRAAMPGWPDWTEFCCDECGKDSDNLIRFGEDPDYEARWQDVCAECVSAAAQMLP